MHKAKIRDNPIEKEIPDPTAYVSIEHAATFITGRIRPLCGYENLGQTFEKVMKRLRYAIAQEHLSNCSEESILFGALIAWIRTKEEWCGAFTDLVLNNSGDAQLEMPSIQCSGVMVSLSPTLELAHAALIEDSSTIDRLKRENAAIRAENEMLKAIKSVDDARRENGRLNGAQGGRGNIKPRR